MTGNPWDKLDAAVMALPHRSMEKILILAHQMGVMPIEMWLVVSRYRDVARQAEAS